MADFEWSYNSRILNPGQRVSLSVQDWTVREILREILGEEYVFKSDGRYLILKKEKRQSTELSGVIREGKSGERLANVTVYDRKTLRATTTDSTGFYQLKVKKHTEIVVVRLGFQDTLVQLSSMTPRHQNLVLTPVPFLPSDSTIAHSSLRKSLRKAASELDHFFNTGLDKWHALNVPDTLQRRFQMSFLPKLGTNHVLSARVENSVSINVLAGQSAGVRGVEVAGLGNFTGNRVAGLQAAGLFNLNRGECSGVQLAGLYNQTDGNLSGIQAAGLVNLARTSSGPSLQAAGLVNTAVEMGGVQVSGLVNSARDMEGVQVAGLVNRARRIKGFQIGVINTATELKGAQFGLLNRSGKRWMPVVNWSSRKAKVE